MPDREALIQALAQLDPGDLEEVITNAYRRRKPVDVGEREWPDPGATAEEFAHWIARRLMSSDSAIEQVIYLPAGSPADEIRLLEINRFLDVVETEPIEPLDFTPDDLAFRVFVADISSNQWERAQEEPRALPVGWHLDDSQIIARA